MNRLAASFVYWSVIAICAMGFATLIIGVVWAFLFVTTGFIGWVK